MQQNSSAIVVYGTSWCPDSIRAQRMLDREGVQYRYIDIDESPEGEALVKHTNRGNRTVPTIFFPDGSVYVEPGGVMLRSKISELREQGLLPEPAPLPAWKPN